MAQASRGERAYNAHIHSKNSSHSRNPSVTPTPSAAGQFPLKRRPQPPWVMHKPISSSASSTSSQETKHRRSTSKTRSCTSAPTTPLKSTMCLDFSDSEGVGERMGRLEGNTSNISFRRSTHTDNEAEPKRGQGRSIKDHSSRRILFNNALRHAASSARPVPAPVVTLDSPHYLLDIESVCCPADVERTVTVFTTESEEMLTPDDFLSSTAPRVRRHVSWKSKLFSKPRAATAEAEAEAEQTAADADVSPMTSTSNIPIYSKEKESSFLRMFTTNKRHTPPATIGPAEQSIAAAANEANVADPKKKSALLMFGKKASRKGTTGVPSPKETKSPLPRACTLSNPPASPSSAKVSLKHAATFGHRSSTDPPSPSILLPKESRNAPGHSGMHTFLHPIQACQAHLYNVHGIGSGPSTFDLLTPTPIPKGGVKRTDPYVELGLGTARVPAVNVIVARRASAPSAVIAEPR